MKKCPVAGCQVGELYLKEGHLTCRKCGAFQRQNQATGNILWMRNGRVVHAEADIEEKEDNLNPFHQPNTPNDPV